MMTISSWRDSNRGVQVKSPDIIPIKYESTNGWGTITRAITTKTTDEAKSWRKEMANYLKGITCKKQVGY
jgi:hypothetical protein